MSEIDILSFGETMAMFVAEQTGDKHRHGFAKREDIDLRHGRSPHGVGQGGPGSRPVVR
ncbi:hypothetical protein GIV33_27810, partial [Pseudomonas carnis]|nr:hypothetical protein [Pseudomonas carnis]